MMLVGSWVSSRAQWMVFGSPNCGLHRNICRSRIALIAKTESAHNDVMEAEGLDDEHA